MPESNTKEKNNINQLGFWSAIIAAILVTIAGITATFSIQPFATIIGFLLTISFLIVMCCIYFYSPNEKKVFSFIGVSFSIVYVTIISVNYFIQLTFVNQTHYDVSMFDMADPQSMMWILEVLGYFFMGLATFFAAFTFKSHGIEKIVKWLFLINGILGILTPIGYGLNFPMEILLGGLILWDIVMPFANITLAIMFKRLQ